MVCALASQYVLPITAPLTLPYTELLHHPTEMRDFSANALMYDPLRRVVLDPVGGVPDLAARRLRLLSEQRIREDPVRILRGIRWVGRALAKGGGGGASSRRSACRA